MAPQPRRLLDLDALRGLAALLVVLHHAWLLVPRQAGTATAWIEAVLDETPLGVLAMGRPAVIFFFVLSGYVLVQALMRRDVPWPHYAAQRAARLFPPVVASVLLSLLLWWLTYAGPIAALPDFANATWREDPVAGEALRQAMLLNNDAINGLNPVLWSLVHEWRLGLLLPLALLFRARPMRLVGLGLAASILAVAGGVPVNTAFLGTGLREEVLTTLYFTLPFAVGAALALAGPMPCLSARERMLALAAVGLGMLGAEHDLAATGAAALLVVLGAQPGGLAGWLRWRPVLWLGQLSFSLYLVHLPVLAAVLHLGLGRAPLPVLLALGVALSFGAAALIHHVCELPAQRLARALGKARPAARAPARLSHALAR